MGDMQHNFVYAFAGKLQLLRRLGVSPKLTHPQLLKGGSLEACKNNVRMKDGKLINIE